MTNQPWRLVLKCWLAFSLEICLSFCREPVRYLIGRKTKVLTAAVFTLFFAIFCFALREKKASRCRLKQTFQAVHALLYANVRRQPGPFDQTWSANKLHYDNIRRQSNVMLYTKAWTIPLCHPFLPRPPVSPPSLQPTFFPFNRLAGTKQERFPDIPKWRHRPLYENQTEENPWPPSSF